MLSGEHGRPSAADDFWEASALHRLNAAAFGSRVLAYEPPGPAPATLSPTTGAQALPQVGDRVQRWLARRRSGRVFGERRLSQKHVARLLAAAGHSSDGPLVPSAGGLGAVHLYAIGMHVEGALAGRAAKYDPASHAVHDVGPAPSASALRDLFQLQCTGTPQLMVVFVVEPTEMRRKYGPRGDRFALQEVGHVAQNLSLRAGADRLVAYLVGGALDHDVLALLGIDHTPARLGGAIAVGR